jgi:hypothetical protein
MWGLVFCLGSVLLLVSLYTVFAHRRMVRYRRRLVNGNTDPNILAVRSGHYYNPDCCVKCGTHVGRYRSYRQSCVKCGAFVSQLDEWEVVYVGERKPLYYEIVAWLQQEQE